MSFFTADEFSVRVIRNTLRIGASGTHSLPNVFDLFLTHEMAILSKGRKPDNFESHNSLKLRFKNIRGPCSNFVDCESFL